MLCSQLRSQMKCLCPKTDVSWKSGPVLQMFGGMRMFAPHLEPFKLTPQKAELIKQYVMKWKESCKGFKKWSGILMEIIVLNIIQK